MRIGTTEAERIDAGTLRLARWHPRPWLGGRWNAKVRVEGLDARVKGLQVEVGRHRAVAHCKDDLEHTRQSCGAFGVANHSLD